MNVRGLLDYQIPATEQLLAALAKHGGAADWSDMGVGKTYHAVACIRELQRPTLVVCPAISITSWQRVGAAMDTQFSVVNYEMLRTGATRLGVWEHPRPDKLPRFFKCTACQLVVDPAKPSRCQYHFLGVHCIETKTKPHNYGKFIWNHNVKQLVFDEVHRCGALDSLQADMLVAGRRQSIPTFGLSATAAESPLDLRALGYVLGLHSYTDFYAWAARRGCRKVPWGGFEFAVGEAKKREIMGALHAEIFPSRGTRVRIADLGSAFPERQITSELYDLKEGNKINDLYAEMDGAIQALNEQKLTDKCAEHPLTTLLRASEEIELLLVPIFLELRADARASGVSVAFFVNYRRTVDELCRRLGTTCRVDGSQIGAAGARQRQANLDDFQTNRSLDIVLSAAAGNASIGLQDLHGRQRVGLVSVGHSATQFRQICGRIPRQGGQSKALYRIVLASGTVQEKIHKALSGKLDRLDTLNDGDFMAANLPLSSCRISDIFPPDKD